VHFKSLNFQEKNLETSWTLSFSDLVASTLVFLISEKCSLQVATSENNLVALAVDPTGWNFELCVTDSISSFLTTHNLFQMTLS